MMVLVSGLGSNETVLNLWKKHSWGEDQLSESSMFFLDDIGRDVHVSKWSSQDE